MLDADLLRYSRHILLPQFGIAGQERLHNSTVLIVGLGGLGSPVALYLAAAGVGRLLLADFDEVELSNLQRQIVHRTDHIGLSKAESARRTLHDLNPTIELIAIEHALTAETLAAQLAGVDLVVECSDNFATRFAVNAACHAAQIPLVSGAAIRLEGQVTAFSGQLGGPCYRCLYADEDAGAEAATCTDNGVLAPVVGIIGSVQATEAIKILTGLGTPLFGRLLLLDAMDMDWRTVRLRADPACPVCGG